VSELTVRAKARAADPTDSTLSLREAAWVELRHGRGLGETSNSEDSEEKLGELHGAMQ
jgi:hypothetical protein